MHAPPRRRPAPAVLVATALLGLSVVLAACGGPSSAAPASSKRHASPTSAGHATAASRRAATTARPLAPPHPLVPFSTAPVVAGAGSWTPAGRVVDGTAAVEETHLVPPGGTQPAGIAWMDSNLLSARLYSGSLSPGGGPYPYTAPIQPAQAASVVAVFNGGFQMKTAQGGYYTTSRLIDPLVPGAASLVIDSNGSVRIGAWDATVSMTPDVVAVRQNLVPLVAGGQPTPTAASADWQAWGNTCGATACTATTPGVEHQWRSGVGTTADGALVYATGPGLSPLQLADLLVRAGAVEGMQLDINPDWDVFVTYDPPTPGGLATPANGGKLVATTVQGPGTFFEPAWARDFITMSARPSPVTAPRPAAAPGSGPSHGRRGTG